MQSLFWAKLVERLPREWRLVLEALKNIGDNPLAVYGAPKHQPLFRRFILLLLYGLCGGALLLSVIELAWKIYSGAHQWSPEFTAAIAPFLAPILPALLLFLAPRSRTADFLLPLRLTPMEPRAIAFGALYWPFLHMMVLSGTACLLIMIELLGGLLARDYPYYFHRTLVWSLNSMVILAMIPMMTVGCWLHRRRNHWKIFFEVGFRTYGLMMVAGVSSILNPYLGALVVLACLFLLVRSAVQGAGLWFIGSVFPAEWLRVSWMERERLAAKVGATGQSLGVVVERWRQGALREFLGCFGVVVLILLGALAAGVDADAEDLLEETGPLLLLLLIVCSAALGWWREHRGGPIPLVSGRLGVCLPLYASAPIGTFGLTLALLSALAADDIPLYAQVLSFLLVLVLLGLSAVSALAWTLAAATPLRGLAAVVAVPVTVLLLVALPGGQTVELFPATGVATAVILFLTSAFAFEALHMRRMIRVPLGGVSTEPLLEPWEDVAPEEVYAERKFFG